MSTPGLYGALNRLLTILCRSLPVYLLNTSPWTHRGDAEALAVMRRIGEANTKMGERVAEYIIDHYGPPEVGKFPIDFFDTHDLSLDYLVKKLVQCQRQDVASIEALLPQLIFERPAAALAEEALGAARAHLETVEELTGQLVKQA